MIIKSLKIQSFRNIKSAAIQFNPNINVIVGNNGQGKTNLVESIYLALRGHSFRFAKNSDFIGFNSEYANIIGELKSNELPFTFQLVLSNKKKSHFLNKKQVPIFKIAQLFPIVLFSPESLSCIKEGSEQRRQLLDEFLINISPIYAQILEDFNRALRARNKILKSLGDKSVNRSIQIEVLNSLNPAYFQLAIEVTKRRLEAIKLIINDFKEAASDIFNNNVDISVEYVASDQIINNFSNEEVEKLLIDRSHQLHDAELSSGTSLVGPHKHDIKFLYNRNDSRIFCSQGQQRALILSFKIAQIVYHKRALKVYPILVLDDVLSELDKDRRESLIQFLGKIQTQIFITTTDEVQGLHLLRGDHGMIQVSDGNFEWTK